MQYLSKYFHLHQSGCLAHAHSAIELGLYYGFKWASHMHSIKIFNPGNTETMQDQAHGELIMSCQRFQCQAFIYQVVVFPWT